MKVLIAEDDNVARMILKTALAQLGHDVTAASNGKEAWEFCLVNEFEVIVSDRSMPGLDGIELCRRVRARDDQPYVYFIFLTSAKERGRIMEGMEVGADDYLLKPLELNELSARLTVAGRITDLYRALEDRRIELQALNRQLHDMARTDPLTELGTRLKLREDLDCIAAAPRDCVTTYCAVMCDVDHFKQYNDTYGHLGGDDVLRAVATTIKTGLREGDEAYRYGGEEFLLILRSASLEAGQASAERHRAAIEDLRIPHQTSTSRFVTISCGAALFQPGVGRPVHAWLEEADGALYRAKSMGRNCVVLAHDAGAVLDE